MSPAARRGLLAFLIGLAVIAGGVAVEYWRMIEDGAEGAAATPAGIAVGGPFVLIDQNGVTRQAADFRGKLMLVYFGYTYCPDVCPTTLQTMTAALEQLGDRAAEIQPIFVTVDPERDTPAQLKSYIANFDPRFIALTGAPDQIAAVAKAYRVFYQKADDQVAASGKSDDYSVDHSSYIYLMGRDGRYLFHFSPDAAPETLAAALAERL